MWKKVVFIMSLMVSSLSEAINLKPNFIMLEPSGISSGGSSSFAAAAAWKDGDDYTNSFHIGKVLSHDDSLIKASDIGGLSLEVTRTFFESGHKASGIYASLGFSYKSISAKSAAPELDYTVSLNEIGPKAIGGYQTRFGNKFLAQVGIGLGMPYASYKTSISYKESSLAQEYPELAEARLNDINVNVSQIKFGIELEARVGMEI